MCAICKCIHEINTFSFIFGRKEMECRLFYLLQE